MPEPQRTPLARSGTPPKPSTPATEPELVLPTLTLLLGQAATAVAMVIVWLLMGLFLGDPVRHGAAGALGAGLVTFAAVASTLAGLPWIPKPASTAMLAWLACSMLRMVVAPGLVLLLYSAPFAGRLEALSSAKASMLLALASTFFVGLLVEVALIARHLHRIGRAGQE